MKKIILTSFISAIILLSLVSPAFAHIATHWVMGYESSQYNFYGTFGYLYTMYWNAVRADGMHLNSLYSDTNLGGGRYFAEIGWAIDKHYAAPPRYFRAYCVHNVYYGPYFWSGYYAAEGSTHYYYVRLTSPPNGDTWRWVIDGTLWAQHGIIGQYIFQRGHSECSSEKHWSSGVNETNYANFDGLKKMDSAGNWYYWSNLQWHGDNDNIERPNDYDLWRRSGVHNWCFVDKVSPAGSGWIRISYD